MAEFRDATQGYAVLTGVILTQKKKKKNSCSCILGHYTSSCATLKEK